MEIICLNRKLDECDKADLIKHGIELIICDYTIECHEGYGNALAYKEGKWYAHDMGHCSCYGPFEHFTLKNPFDDFEDAIKTLKDEDWSRSFDDSINEIRKRAKEWIEKKYDKVSEE